MVGHGGSSAGSYLADPTSPIPSQCASIVVTSNVRVNNDTIMAQWHMMIQHDGIPIMVSELPLSFLVYKLKYCDCTIHCMSESPTKWLHLNRNSP